MSTGPWGYLILKAATCSIRTETHFSSPEIAIHETVVSRSNSKFKVKVFLSKLKQSVGSLRYIYSSVLPGTKVISEKWEILKIYKGEIEI